MSKRVDSNFRGAARRLGASPDASDTGATGAATQAGAEQASPPGQPISELFAEIMREVPDEELARLPLDWSENHDHYLYGAPKRR